MSVESFFGWKVSESGLASMAAAVEATPAEQSAPAAASGAPEVAMTPAEAGLQGACLEKPTRERAIQQYALAHELSPSKVTDDLLEKSELGMEGWACSGLDVNARGPVGNAMYRSFGKHPNMKETYKWLFDDLKRKFRCAWAPWWSGRSGGGEAGQVLHQELREVAGPFCKNRAHWFNLANFALVSRGSLREVE